MPEPISLNALQDRITALELAVITNTLLSSGGSSVNEVVAFAKRRADTWKHIAKIAGGEDGSPEVGKALERLSTLLGSLAETVAEDNKGS